MDVQRIRWEIQRAMAQFPNIETYPTIGGGICIKALLQTSVGQIYVLRVTFVGYPSEIPKVTVISPAVTHSKHMYTSGNICYMHPNLWNPAKHDLVFVLAQSSVWLNKHEVFKQKRVWPGPALAARMNMAIYFTPLSMTELRNRPGEILDRVAHHGECFAIRAARTSKSLFGATLGVPTRYFANSRIAEEVRSNLNGLARVATHDRNFAEQGNRVQGSAIKVI